MDKEQDMLTARVLQGQGKTRLEISHELGVCERTVRNYFKQLPRPRRKADFIPLRWNVEKVRVKNTVSISSEILEQTGRFVTAGVSMMLQPY